MFYFELSGEAAWHIGVHYANMHAARQYARNLPERRQLFENTMASPASLRMLLGYAAGRLMDNDGGLDAEQHTQARTYLREMYQYLDPMEPDEAVSVSGMLMPPITQQRFTYDVQSALNAENTEHVLATHRVGRAAVERYLLDGYATVEQGQKLTVPLVDQTNLPHIC
jgi:hypothetical protein